MTTNGSSSSNNNPDTVHEPLIIYRNILIPLMKAAGFELDNDSSDNVRYQSRFIYRTTYVEQDPRSEYYGQQRQFDSKVDVLGIPMGYSFLFLHGIMVGSLADECENVKVKIRCGKRSPNLSIPGAESSPPLMSLESPPKEPSSMMSLLLLKSNNRNGNTTDGQLIHQNQSSPESDECLRERIRLQLQTEFVYKLISMFSLRLDDLPKELKLLILSMLPLKSIVAMSQASNHWRDLSIDEQLWKLLVQKFYPDLYRQRVVGQSWKALFKDEYRRQRVLERRRLEQELRFLRPLALPPSPPLLPIEPPPYLPMLPPPIDFIRDRFSGILHPPFHDDELLDNLWNHPSFPDNRRPQSF